MIFVVDNIYSNVSLLMTQKYIPMFIFASISEVVSTGVKKGYVMDSPSTSSVPD